MKIYFLSSFPCALTVNGAYFGVTDGFERSAEIALKDRVFVQFSPQGKLPVGFFLTENIRFAPPEGCEVYLLRDGIAVYARDFPPTDFALRPVWQKRFNGLLATLFFQGELQLSIDSEQGAFVTKVPPELERSEAEFSDGLLFLRSEKHLAVYTQKAEPVLCERVLSHKIENGELFAVLPLSDCMGRLAECTWRISENGLTRTSFTLKQARTKDGKTDEKKIAEELLPYAFFESVLIGANYAEMLSDGLAPDANKIADFLGDFIAVTPTEKRREVALLRKKGDRLFEAAYFYAETENGKITDIKKL